MKSYTVYVREVVSYPVEIQAKNQEEAAEKVESGEGKSDENNLTFLSVLPRDTWEVWETVSN